MLIGVDFDNTIVSYDALFHRVALERGLIPADLPSNKTAVRDHLRATGRETVWTEMQGEVYGARLSEAAAFAGAREFFVTCRAHGIRVVIISHKTRYPYLGERHDLHAAALRWLQQNGFVARSDDDAVFFELTKSEKIARIASAGCTHFVDDLPEILSDANFSATIQSFLFDPSGAAVSSGRFQRVASWSDFTTEITSQAEICTAARALLSKHGIQAEGTLTPVAGGANNRVYRMTTAPGTEVLVKRYFSHANDRRDRFRAEHALYDYTEWVRATQVPEPLGWDAERRVAVFRFVPGVRPSAATPTLIDEALAFIGALNRDTTDPIAAALPIASEACFSIAAHLQTVGARISRLETALAAGDSDDEARHLVGDVFRPAWDAIEADIRQRVDAQALSRELPADERCVSPSDFGFHNCLLSPAGKAVFFDFEYAGWDDPAKLVCDFFCQPEVPSPIETFTAFVARVAAILRLRDSEAFAARCQMLLPVYRIKWSCILLNEFTAVGRNRREFSLGTVAADARRDRQLSRVRALLPKLPVPV